MGLWEVLTSRHTRAEEARAMLITTSAGSLLRGVVSVREEAGGWVRPVRFLEVQIKALTSCMAWHPGLYRQMAATTAGVCVRFATDATEVALAVKVDPEPRGTAAVLAELDQGSRRRPHDGVSATVDGEAVGCVWPQEVMRQLPWIEESEGLQLVTFSLNGAGRGDEGIMTIPGLGARHEVTIWLPCLRGCVVRELWVDGTYVEPLPERPRMLVLGDSIAQGFCCDDPAATWPALVSEQRGYDLLNQSIRGQVFQASSLLSPSEREATDTACVFVALGANYVWDACAPALVEREAHALMREVRRLYPNAAIFSLTPTWYDAQRIAACSGTCLEQLPDIINRVAVAQGVQVLDGQRLLKHKAELLADGIHPTKDGHARIARSLLRDMDMDKDGDAS